MYTEPNSCIIFLSNMKVKHLFQECTDERLKRINEVLIGIKIIKLNGWENVFKEKIQNTRQEELKYLIKDSIYWTLMSKCIRNQLPLKPLFISK